MKVHDLAVAVLDHEKAIQNAERQGGHGEEVERRRDLAMVVQEGEPALSFVGVMAALPLLQVARDGSGKPQPLTRSTAVQLPFSFSPDGTRLAYGELTPGAGGEIRTVPVET